MDGDARSRWPAAALATLVAAEAGARVLRPRPAEAPEPAPVSARSYFTAAEIERARAHRRPQPALAAAQALAQAGLLAALARRRVRARSAPSERRAPARPLRDALAGARLAATLGAVALPFAALARRRALAVGLATQSWRGWAADAVKAQAIESVMAAAVAALALAVVRRRPRDWWLLAGPGSVALGGALATLGPVLLAPRFNRFSPLPEGDARDDVLALAGAAGVRVGEVFGVDASRRTVAANAYVTGLGPTKRVVLYDTLLEGFARDEVRIVVAHELSHVRHRDVWRSLAFSALVALPAALTARELAARFGARGAAAGAPGALPALALAAGLAGAPATLAAARLSRAVERRADAEALRMTGAPGALVAFWRGLAVRNLADPDPPGLPARLLATHPPVVERIGAALAYERAARDL
ncbi:MAG: M48 family metalloprotease [Solirubrobacteraceae bacterium]